VLSNDRTRQKMILYLALLSATNREAASAYYELMSQTQQTVGMPGWLESLDEETLDEIALLYTLGANHPAFAFVERLMLNEILLKVAAQLYKYKVPRNFSANCYSHIQVSEVSYEFLIHYRKTVTVI